MAEGDGRNSPEPRVPRKQGRQPKDLAASAGGAQREFAELIRTEFFDRLTALGLTTADISEALGSGFSATTLSRFRNADRVPDRDKLLRLLAYAEEIVGQPLPGKGRERVIEAYYAALKITNKPPAAVGQYETGVSRPRPDLMLQMAKVLNVPVEFFIVGRPSQRLDAILRP